MNADPHPYTAYKPSGTPWLGDVPEHWEVAQLGRIGVFSKGSGGTKDDEVPVGIPCVRYGDLYTTHKYFINQTQSYISPAKASSYTPIKMGDVLFPTSGETIEEIGKSAVNLMPTQVLCGGDLIIFRPTIPIEPKFTGYALDCPAAQTQKSLMGRGITIMHIYSSQLKYLWLPLPPLAEQAAIVRYLDHADGRIRRYVSAKRKLIALLEEEKQAVINQAVTRGLDPNVHLKPSGVEWLGEVPEHWEVRRLKNWTGINEAILPETTAPDFEFRYVEIGAVETGKLVAEPCLIRFAAAPSRARRIVKGGDTIISTVRTYLKAVWFASGANDDLICSTGFAVLTPRQETVPKFVNYVVQSDIFTDRVTAESVGIAYPAISESRFGSLQVCVPPLDEQAAIVEYLDEATVGIDAAIARARRQIELVEEYRTRLIADVVTGKLDVRAAAGQLREEAGREGRIDDAGLIVDNAGNDPYDTSHPAKEASVMDREVIA